MMTRAPAALANWRAKMETPPVPRQRTVWPGFDGIAGGQECVPCGDCGAGERGAFFEGVVVGEENDAVFVERDQFGEHTVC